MSIGIKIDFIGNHFQFILIRSNKKAKIVNFVYYAKTRMDGWVYCEIYCVFDFTLCYFQDVWKEIPHMGCARAGANVAAVNGLLYVIGGRSASDEFSAPATLDTMECYDPQTYSWIDVGTMLMGRCEAGVAVL